MGKGEAGKEGRGRKGKKNLTAIQSINQGMMKRSSGFRNIATMEGFSVLRGRVRGAWRRRCWCELVDGVGQSADFKPAEVWDLHLVLDLSKLARYSDTDVRAFANLVQLHELLMLHFAGSIAWQGRGL
jgi:hypothetical protein